MNLFCEKKKNEVKSYCKLEKYRFTFRLFEKFEKKNTNE